MNNHLIAEYHHKITPGSVSSMTYKISIKKYLFRLWLFNIKVILRLQVLVNYKKKISLIFFSYNLFDTFFLMK
jgi:hypothetical protein